MFPTGLLIRLFAPVFCFSSLVSSLHILHGRALVRQMLHNRIIRRSCEKWVRLEGLLSFAGGSSSRKVLSHAVRIFLQKFVVETQTSIKRVVPINTTATS